MNRRDLEQLLETKSHPVASGMVGKYETGVVVPPVEFIYQVARALRLTGSQEMALLNAAVLDKVLKFYGNYIAHAKKSQKK